MNSRIVLSRLDVLRLRALLLAHPRAGSDREHLSDLEAEIERAVIVEDGARPAEVIAIGSDVRVTDLQSQLQDRYTLVLPAQADVARGRISVLAPLGTALLGARVHDVVEWQMPGGLRQLRIEDVRCADARLARPPLVAA